jgi:hypothetical protein
MSPDAARLLHALPREREYGTSVKALAAMLGTTDRAVRQGIKDLREHHGVPVICLPTTNGVWITDDPAEVDALIACQVSRARSIEQSVRALRQVRDTLAYRPALF